MSPTPAAADAIRPKPLETLRGVMRKFWPKGLATGIQVALPGTLCLVPTAMTTPGRFGRYDGSLTGVTLLARAIGVMERCSAPNSPPSDEEWDAIIAEAKTFLAAISIRG